MTPACPPVGTPTALPTVLPSTRTAMPAAVWAAFGRLAASDGWSDAAWAVRSAVLADRRVDDRPEAWVEEELQLLAAVEQVKAWADFQGLAALRRLREAVGERVRCLDEEIETACGRGMPAHVLRAESDIATVDEVVLAVGLPERQVSRRLVLAIDADGRGPTAAPGARRGSSLTGPGGTRPACQRVRYRPRQLSRHPRTSSTTPRRTDDAGDSDDRRDLVARYPHTAFQPSSAKSTQ